MIWTSSDLQGEGCGASNYGLGSRDLGSRPGGESPRSIENRIDPLGFELSIYNPESHWGILRFLDNLGQIETCKF